MGMGDDVEVEVLGERLPRVARIEALWSERPVDGIERMLARCRFYYRPSVCDLLQCTASQLGVGKLLVISASVSEWLHEGS